MRRYEGVVITDPDIAEEQREQVFSRVQDLIPQAGGTLLEQDDWGVRKLAYPIRKKARGHYVRFDFCGSGALVDEMERFYRIDDRVLKYMTVLLDKDADMEKLKAEADARKAKAAAETAQAASPAGTEAGTDAGAQEAGEPENRTEE